MDVPGGYFAKWSKSDGECKIPYDIYLYMVLVVKKLPVNARDLRHRFDPWVGKILWRRS